MPVIQCNIASFNCSKLESLNTISYTDCLFSWEYTVVHMKAHRLYIYFFLV